ncbi:MAG: two pore domain potassium channel family protein [Tidjanibacter sp.]|nr:two pore domain potassium channel family protein [Tidjanibacter sp.]
MKKQPLTTLARVLDWVAIAAAVVILLSLSLDIVHRHTYLLSEAMVHLQFVVCLVFVLDYLMRSLAAPNPRRYFWRNIVVLLVSIPWLNFMHWGGVELGKGMYIFLKALPLVRGMLGIYTLIRLASPSRVSAIMWSYIAIIVLLTYLAALVFYSYEQGLNPHVTGFGEALWWSGLNVTTVGANIFAVTPMGKVLTVILPGLGMVLFPLLTVYVTHIVENDNSH